ncbi:MAG: ABC transporter permease [Candidatus Glassbacteria bacterium]
MRRNETTSSNNPVRSSSSVFWRRFKKNRVSVAGLLIIGLLYFASVFAGFIAPYSQSRQNRELFYHPPMRIHFIDSNGKFHLRPFVYRTVVVNESIPEYAEDMSIRYPIRFLVRGDEYSLFFVFRSTLHLYGVDEPGRIFLLGTDVFGRDIASRLLFGSQISLSIGIVGIILTFLLGMMIGGISGYFGGVVDVVLMRVTELLMSIPTLYLILALRATIPASVPSTRMYLIIVVILSLIGWASISRIIRGMVLSIREEEYVLAAKALGLGSMRIIIRHILPNTFSFVIVAATVTIPGYILGEVALSFLGFGIQEPQSSWGLMLKEAQSIRVLTSYPWILAPGFFIFITVLAFNFLGDGLRDILDPKYR